MKKNIFVFCFLFFYLGVSNYIFAQTNRMEGQWNLDAVELIEYRKDGSSSLINYNKFQKESDIAGDFEKIICSGDSCFLMGFSEYAGTYMLNGEVLTFNVTAIPYIYDINFIDNDSIRLSRKFEKISLEERLRVLYEIVIFYKKADIK